MDEVKLLLDVEPLITLNNKIQDLKGLNVNLIEEGSASLFLLSKIVNKKLPRQFSFELSKETVSTYPNFNQLLDKHHSVLAHLNLGHKPNENPGAKPKTKEVTSEASSKNNKSKTGFSDSKQFEGKNKLKSKTSNGQASSSLGKCKLCLVSGHTTSKCSDYGTLEARKSKASSLGLGIKCLSDKHKTADCLGNKAAPY